MRSRLRRLHRWWRRKTWKQCPAEAEAANGRTTFFCSRRKGHHKHDPLHMAVFHQIAWQNGEEVPYPEMMDAARRIGKD